MLTVTGVFTELNWTCHAMTMGVFVILRVGLGHVLVVSENEYLSCLVNHLDESHGTNSSGTSSSLCLANISYGKKQFPDSPVVLKCSIRIEQGYNLCLSTEKK